MLQKLLLISPDWICGHKGLLSCVWGVMQLYQAVWAVLWIWNIAPGTRTSYWGWPLEEASSRHSPLYLSQTDRQHTCLKQSHTTANVRHGVKISHTIHHISLLHVPLTTHVFSLPANHRHMICHYSDLRIQHQQETIISCASVQKFHIKKLWIYLFIYLFEKAILFINILT